jgi:hypothetical protein
LWYGQDTWGLRVRIFYPIPNKPPNFTTWRTLPRCVVLDAILLAAAFQVSGKAGLLTIASPMALSLALAAGVFFDIANVFAPKLPYLPEGLVTAKGFARYAGMPLVLFSHMTAFRINATADEPLLPPNASFDGCSALWPVMIFSHGLGGGRTAYSTLVTDLASKVRLHAWILWLEIALVVVMCLAPWDIVFTPDLASIWMSWLLLSQQRCSC